MEIANRGAKRGIENIVAAAEHRRAALPFGISLTSLPQVRAIVITQGARLPSLHERGYRYLQLKLFQGGQIQLPPCCTVPDFCGRRFHLDECVPQNSIQSTVIEGHAMVVKHRPIILSVGRAGTTTHLEYVDKIRFKAQFNPKFDRAKVEILKRKAVEEYVVPQQLLAANVDGVFWQIE